jgi:hypothetical protein
MDKLYLIDLSQISPSVGPRKKPEFPNPQGPCTACNNPNGIVLDDGWPMLCFSCADTLCRTGCLAFQKQIVVKERRRQAVFTIKPVSQAEGAD